jgi:hypothetical protein
VGSSQRLKNGEQRQSIIETLIACIINAETEDRKVREWLNIMEENASQEYKPVIQLIIKWQEQVESYLKKAKDSLQSIGVSFPIAQEPSA